jgi:hypothetical protein
MRKLTGRPLIWINAAFMTVWFSSARNVGQIVW